MRKILYVTALSETINTVLISHIDALIKQGYKVDCACNLNKPIERDILRKGVKVYDIPFTKNILRITNIKSFYKLCDIQRINRYDVIHVHTPIAAIYVRLLKLKFPELKVIYTSHGYNFFKNGPMVPWLISYPIEILMANFTDIIININKEDYEITKNKLRPNKCYYLNGLGVDRNKYQELSLMKIWEKKLDLDIKIKDYTILMIADVGYKKSYIQFIKAMSMLKNMYPNIKAICIAEGKKLNKISERIDKKKLSNNIRILDSTNDINELINISDIGLLLSYREELAQNAIKFMACGKKVIANNIEVCKEVINSSDIGTLVNINDYKEIAKAIEKHYLEGSTDGQISTEIYKYDIRNINESLLDIYLELLGDERFINGKALYAINR